MKTVRDNHLKNAPIIEAIIDARMVFAEPPEVDALRAFAETLSGVDKVEDVYRFEAQIDITGDSPPDFKRTYLGLRLFLNSGECAAHLRPDGLSFSKLKPYDRWESLESRFLELLEIYRDTFGTTPIRRLGVRYINHIDLLEKDEPKHLLQAYPIPANAEGKRSELTFSQVAEYRSPDSVGSRVAQLWDSEKKRFILDLDAFQEFTEGLDDRLLGKFLNRLRLEKNELFWGTLTDSALKRFE